MLLDCSRKWGSASPEQRYQDSLLRCLIPTEQSWSCVGLFTVQSALDFALKVTRKGAGHKQNFVKWRLPEVTWNNKCHVGLWVLAQSWQEPVIRCSSAFHLASTQLQLSAGVSQERAFSYQISLFFSACHEYKTRPLLQPAHQVVSQDP